MACGEALPATAEDRGRFSKLLGKKEGEGELAGFLEELRGRGVDVGAMGCSETDPFQGRMTAIAFVIHKVREPHVPLPGLFV